MAYNAQDKYNQNEGYSHLYGPLPDEKKVDFNKIGSSGDGALGTHEAAQALRYVGRNVAETGRQIKEGVTGAVKDFYNGAPLRSDLGDQAGQPKQAVPTKKAPAGPTEADKLIADTNEALYGDKAQASQPTYRDGYQPPSRAQQLAEQKVAYDPAAADQWRKDNNVTAPAGAASQYSAIPSSAQRNTDAFGNTRTAETQRYLDDQRREKLKDEYAALQPQGVDPGNYNSWAEFLAGASRTKAANAGLARQAKGLDMVNRLDDSTQDRRNRMEMLQEQQAGQDRRAIWGEEGADRRIGMQGEETRRNKEFDEGLESTKAQTALSRLQGEEAQARTGKYALEASSAGQERSLRQRLAGTDDPTERAAIQREIYDLTGTKPQGKEEILAKIAEAYNKVSGGMGNQEGFREFAKSWLADMNKMRDGGMVEGYADGGAIGAGGGMLPDQSLQTALPFINDYRRYSMMTQNMGATPVGLEDFAYMRGAAKNAQTAMPGMGMPQQGSQMGMQAFADGGSVGDQIYRGIGEAGLAVTRAGAPVYDAVQNFGGAIGRGIYGMTHNDVDPTQQPQQPQQQPVRNMFLNRTRDIDRAAGFAEGGAIPVAGRKVLGPGTGTSDSIPAIIDGERPAALSTGEYVIPADVVKAKGTEFFDKLLAQYNGEKKSSGA